MSKSTLSKESEYLSSLCDFVDCVESTGGVVKVDGFYVPVADQDWIDLGETYIKACEVLNKIPKFFEEG